MASEAQVTWGTATVLEADDVALGVRRLVLAPVVPAPARPGAHVDVRLPPPVGSAERTLTRSYSVVSSEDGGRRLTVSVRLEPSSRGGSRRMHALVSGDELAVSAPLQNFPLGVGAARYVLVAGGIGITALMAMAATLRGRGADYQLLLVGRGRAALPYVDRLAADHGDRFRLHLTDEHGRLDPGEIVREIAAHESAGRTELYTCGPIGLMEALGDRWRAAGLPPTNLRFETFGNSGSWEAEAFTLRIPRLGREVNVPADATALEALEGAGLPVMSDCRKGECGLCTVKVLDVDGRIDHRDVFLDAGQKAAADRMCVCVSRIAAPDRPRGTAVIDLP